MLEIIRRPEKRIEDFQAILKGRDEVEGITEFGTSFICEDLKGYLIDVPGNKSGMRISFVIDRNGKFMYGSGYYDMEPGAEPKPLEPEDVSFVDQQITRADKIIDETIATFQEGVDIDPHDKEIAIDEESQKISTAIRSRIVSIPNLDSDFCKAKSAELQTKKSEVAPSVVNSFSEEDWIIVIRKAIMETQQEDFRQTA